MERRKIMRKGYVTLSMKIPYHYDEDGVRVYEYKDLYLHDINSIKPLCCPGFDVDGDEDGQTMVNCDCKQCIDSRKTEVDYHTSIAIESDIGIKVLK